MVTERWAIVPRLDVSPADRLACLRRFAEYNIRFGGIEVIVDRPVTDVFFEGLPRLLSPSKACQSDCTEGMSRAVPISRPANSLNGFVCGNQCRHRISLREFPLCSEYS